MKASPSPGDGGTKPHLLFHGKRRCVFDVETKRLFGLAGPMPPVRGGNAGALNRGGAGSETEMDCTSGPARYALHWAMRAAEVIGNEKFLPAPGGMFFY